MKTSLGLPGIDPPRGGYLDTSAVLSACGVYRYDLRRRWTFGNPVIFIGLNPSTADAHVDDQTIRTCVRYAKRWGAGALIMLNLFAYRSRDPKALAKVEDPVGPECDAYIRRALVPRPIHVVAAWGASAMAIGRDDDVVRLVRDVTGGDPALSHLALNDDGSPHHPLYLPTSLTPQPYALPEGDCR